MSDHKGDSPLQALWMSMTGTSSGHHEVMPGLDGKSQSVGHEPDKFNVRGIIYVPIAVVLTLITTYLIVTGLFTYINDRGGEQLGLPDANERMARISSNHPVAQEQDKPGVPQPRMEFMEQRNYTRPGEAQPDPIFMRSTFAKDDGNNPKRIYPESLRSENFVDPTTNKKVLSEYDWVVKDKVAQIPLKDAVNLLLTTKKLPTMRWRCAAKTISMRSSTS